MNINILSHLILFFFITNSIFSIEPEDSLKDNIKNTSKEIDSLIINKYQYFNYSPYNKNKIDTFSSANDLVYEYRISKFNIDAKIDIDFNEDVKKFIEMYTIRKKDEMALILARSEIYFPIYEEYLDKYDLPLELKYLSVIESGLNPNARSRSGAVGLWQFMYNTGKMLDLEIDNYIDDRKDPYKSTEAACKYLNYLYNTFNNWELAIAAYNGGPGTVRNAIIRAGGEQDFWKIKKYLPKQTQDYVPIYLAAIYSFTYYKEHNITPKKLDFNYYNTDTLSVRGNLFLNKVADAIGLPYEDIIFLNPRFKHGYIPNNKSSYYIVLPSYKISDFISSTNYLNKNDTEDKSQVYKKPKHKIIHTVEEGEYFHKIAINYGCTIKNIMQWNNLDTNKVHPGQKLIIYTSIEDLNN